MTNYSDEHDECKVFLSRIPEKFSEERLKEILARHFGRSGDDTAAAAGDDKDAGEQEDDKEGGEDNNNTNVSSLIEVSLLAPKEEGRDVGGAEERKGDDYNKASKHRGCAFATFPTVEMCQKAIEQGTIKEKASENSKRKYTIYIRPVVREDESGGISKKDNGNGCFLWERKGHCPYGSSCKFEHPESTKGGDGSGDNDEKKGEGEPDGKRQRIRKCFNFKKKGTCKDGDACPFLHVAPTSKPESEKEGADAPQPKQKHCINWKTKGRCRTKDCPFRHDESVKEKLLAKKKSKTDELLAKQKSKTDELAVAKQKAKEAAPTVEKKKKQPLWCRVFGLSYNSTEESIRKLFDPCGTIDKVEFPVFEDSGRSKGYCGVLFQSPKAVQKAVETLDGTELDGRWLRVQEGKMMLGQWERREKERDDAAAGEGDENMNQGDEQSGEVVTTEKDVGEFGQKVKKRKKHGFDQ
jgi:RNA recognition motif-containing protein